VEISSICWIFEEKPENPLPQNLLFQKFENPFLEKFLATPLLAVIFKMS